MNRIRPSIVACLAAVFSFVAPLAIQAAETDLLGGYRCVGKSPAGTEYIGTVRITKKGDVYAVRWSIGDADETYDGTGVLVDDVFAVGYSGGFAGVVMYKVEKTGTGLKLNGKWAVKGGTTVQSEVLTKRSGK